MPELGIERKTEVAQRAAAMVGQEAVGAMPAPAVGGVEVTADTQLDGFVRRLGEGRSGDGHGAQGARAKQECFHVDPPARDQSAHSMGEHGGVNGIRWLGVTFPT